MAPVLLDSAYLIDLQREIDSGHAGPAMEWLRRSRSKPDRVILVSSVSVAEFLEGCENEMEGLEFVARYVPQTIGFKHARKCALVQKRGRANGKRFGENDAWQLAVAACANAHVVSRDRKAFQHLGDSYEEYA